jgi:hypothetical protein
MDDKEARRFAECFARLDTVFPMGADGLRHTPPECLECDLKTDCLRAALAGEHGSAVHEERLARAYEAGAVGFLQRWAQQKTFQRGKKVDAPWRLFWKRLRRNPRG